VRRLLVSWIGHTDIKSLIEGSDRRLLAQIKKIVNEPYEPPDDGGPIKTLLANEKFDAVYLINNNPNSIADKFIKSLPVQAEHSSVKLISPTDYGSIYTVASDFLRQVISKQKDQKFELSILLSPGTPAMAAVWVLLGKTSYNAVFWQTWKGKAKREEIPFDLTVDIVPELLSGSDTIFHRLATQSPEQIHGFEDITGNTKILKIAVGRAQKAAMRDVPVLLTGESGTGKEMFARAIRKASRRHNKPFKAINCAALPRELLESELFGHVKGAFTGADGKKDGAFKQADGGILFLDEIGECDPQVQAKLLRVLEPHSDKPLCYREFSPVGSEKMETSNVRVIAATNRNLLKMVEDNTFREDLYYRLAVITIKLPSLRERKADIPRIAEALLKRINNDFARDDEKHEHKKFSHDVNNFLKKCDWPGNVRELYNVILQAAVMTDKKNITACDISSSMIETPGKAPADDLADLELDEDFNLEKHLKSIREQYLSKAIKQAGGVKTKAAQLLGFNSYQTMNAQMKKLGIDPESLMD
jgi:transcriptional regulator with PAS, ATPase and Fis domain